MYKYFACLVRFIPKYFIPLDTIVNRIKKKFLFDCSLSVYRNATDFCVLILHSAVSLDSFIGLTGFCFFFSWNLLSFLHIRS